MVSMCKEDYKPVETVADGISYCEDILEANKKLLDECGEAESVEKTACEHQIQAFESIIGWLKDYQDYTENPKIPLGWE